MSYDINQYYGLGIKLKDIESFLPEEAMSIIPTPFEVRNKPEVTKEILIQHDLYTQFALIEKKDPSGRVNASATIEEIKAELIKNSEPEDSFVCGLKKTLNHLIKSFQKHKENHLSREQVESIMDCCLTCYLTYEVKVLKDASVMITSTRWGDVHNLGGMITDEPYLILNDWLSAKEGSWQDPRKNPRLKQELKNIETALVGEKHSGFQLLTPVFGG